MNTTATKEFTFGVPAPVENKAFPGWKTFKSQTKPRAAGINAQLDYVRSSQDWKDAQEEFSQAKNSWKSFKFHNDGSDPKKRDDYIEARKEYLQAQLSFIEAEQQLLDTQDAIIEDAEHEWEALKANAKK